jgi:hypothetical protein
VGCGKFFFFKIMMGRIEKYVCTWYVILTEDG